MVTIINRKRLLIALVLVAAYAILSIWYFLAIDPQCQVRNILGSDINMAMPLPYILIVAVFIAAYSRIFRQKLKAIAYPAAAMAVILPFFLLLAELKIGMRSANPFSNTREIYGIYASVYFIAIFSAFSMLGGSIFRRLFKSGLSGPIEGGDSFVHSIIFHLPILIYFVCIAAMFFMNGLAVYASCLLLLFMGTLFFEKPSSLLGKAKELIVRLAENEKLFVLGIFIIAFLIRYFWGIRLMGLTGAKFTIASDDGVCYDELAGILAGGKLIPAGQIYNMSGFGYWYFLAAVYKIFGPHNFRAAVAVQSFVGAFVPVLAFFIGQRVFKTRFAPALASVIICFDMLLIFLSVVIGMESVYIPLVALALAIAVYFLDGRSFGCKEAFLMGCAVGLAYNARPPELLLFPLILACVIYIFMKRTLSAGRIMRAIVSLFTGFVLLASIQLVTNYVLYGELRLPFPSAIGQTYVLDQGESEALHAEENARLGRIGFDIFRDPKGSLCALAHEPFAVTMLLSQGFLKRLSVLYFIPNFGVFDPLYLVNPASGYFFRFPLYVQFFGYILTAAGMAVAVLRKNRTAGTIILLAFLLYRSAGIAFMFVLNARYRGALLPIFILFFAYGVEIFYRKVRSIYSGEKNQYAE
jgi:hypothetical protein